MTEPGATPLSASRIAERGTAEVLHDRERDGTLVQVHGLRDGERHLIAQGAFHDTQEAAAWTRKIAEHEASYDGPLEIHTQDSPQFFIQVAMPAKNPAWIDTCEGQDWRIVSAED